MLYKLSDGEALYVTDCYREVTHEHPGLYVSRSGQLFNWGSRFLATYDGSEWKRIEALLSLSNVPYREVKNPSAEAAKLLAKGRIVGLFQGRMEFGPHSLGNRSILGDPRDPKTRDVVSKRVKQRESFMPFAACILADKVSEYFDLAHLSPFMLLVASVLPEKRDVIPSVTHVDGTARVHTVEKDGDALYRNLIVEFEKLTGVPVVLNASFNTEEEPIVRTPKDALRCFYTTGIDDLIIGDFLVSKTEAPK